MFPIRPYTIAQILFSLELCAIPYFCFFGPHGLRTIALNKQQNAHMEQANREKAKIIAQLEHELVAWTTNDFYKERFAREQLSMARKDDEIYYFSR